MNRLRVSVLSADVPADRDRWSALGEHLDAYYTAGHASALAGVEGGLAYAYLARDAWGSQVLYPFVRRDLTRLEYIGQEGQGLSDITTPYGYGGPAYVGANCRTSEMMRESRTAFGSYCTTEGIVSEFVRYHPLLGSHACEAGNVHVEAIRTTVAMRPPVDKLTHEGRQSSGVWSV